MAANHTLLDRLSGLSVVPAPSGREDALRTVVMDRWRPFCEEIAVDEVGNLVARVGASGRRILVLAHLDQIGWVVRHVTDDGFLLLDSAQGKRNEGPEPRHMVGHAVVVLGRDGVVAEGFVAAASGHVLTKEQLETPIGGWDDFFVDVGQTSAEEVAALGIHIGSPVVFRGGTRAVGRRLVGTAMDDRALLCAIELLLERLDSRALGVELHVAATVQEESGLHGARALAARQRFDEVIALDVGLVGDIPTVGRERYPTQLGDGPILVHKDALIAYDHDLTWRLADQADAAGVPWQHGVFAGYGSDGVPFAQAGMPTALVCVPTRYTHSPFETIDGDDVEALVALLVDVMR
jgi:putative aminopeptidase FrvX